MPRLKANLPMLLHTEAQSPFAEAYRKLKINIDFAACGRKIKTIVVTSANPGEGKSTAALHLAVSYAGSGKKVLIIDGDVRKPVLHMHLGKGANTGLTDYLAYPNSVVFDIIRDTVFDNISFISAGTPPPNPTDLLASERMDSLLEEVKRRYDIVVIDTPPLLSVIDAKIVAAKSDGVILVLESGKTKQDIAKKAMDELHQVKANVLGAVLNKVSGKANANYPY